MAFEVPLLDLAFTADSNYATTGQYLFVKVNGATQVGTTSATTDTIVGVMQNKPGSLQAAAVRVLGVSKLVAGGALTAGSLISTDAAGKGTMVAVATGTTQYSVGIALDTVTAANQLVSVLMTHPGRGA